MIVMDINKYLQELEEAKKTPDWILEMERFAKENNVPIMEPNGISFLKQCIQLRKPSKILEIGTAIGYSSLQMLEAHPDATIVTLERNPDMVHVAKKNIRKRNKEEAIMILEGDALELKHEVEKHAPFDMIFIDAAKGQYQHFFELYEPMLSHAGVIITDNVLFKGFVANDNDAPKRLKNMINKIRGFNNWLMKRNDYETNIYPIGDGIALSIKKQENR